MIALINIPSFRKQDAFVTFLFASLIVQLLIWKRNFVYVKTKQSWKEKERSFYYTWPILVWPIWC